MKIILAGLVIGTATLGFAAASVAASNEAKTAYKAAADNADAQYKTALAKCGSLNGNGKDVCVAEAKADRTRTKSEAEAQYRNTARARSKARIDIANADYAAAKARCGNRAGNDKNVCIKEAQAAKVTAVANAKADKKISGVRADAREDKHDAAQKVALEKCDALSGAGKDKCVAAAKAK